MTQPMFGQLTGKESLEELIDRVAKLQKQVEYLMGGRLSTKNIREIGGWQAGPTELASQDGDVGMSTEDTGADDVRLWAGGANKNTAPWRVTKGGKMHATGATIESASGYPKIEFDPSDNLVKAYLNANEYIAIDPDLTGAPTLYAYSNGEVIGTISNLAGKWSLYGFSSDTHIASNYNVDLQPGAFYRVRVPNWDKLYSLGDGVTLKQTLDNISFFISSLTATAANHEARISALESS